MIKVHQLNVAKQKETKDVENMLTISKRKRKRKKSFENKYSCGICTEMFKKKDMFDRHMFGHTGEVAN